VRLCLCVTLTYLLQHFSTQLHCEQNKVNEMIKVCTLLLLCVCVVVCGAPGVDAQRCEHCAGGDCVEGSVCGSGCQNGWWGPSWGCSNKCVPHCATASCGLNTGFCEKGCEKGFYTHLCDLPCPIGNNCTSGYCDQTTGFCASAPPDSRIRFLEVLIPVVIFVLICSMIARFCTRRRRYNENILGHNQRRAPVQHSYDYNYAPPSDPGYTTVAHAVASGPHSLNAPPAGFPQQVQQQGHTPTHTYAQHQVQQPLMQPPAYDQQPLMQPPAYDQPPRAIESAPSKDFM
jgi:hypothetical protein